MRELSVKEDELELSFNDNVICKSRHGCSTVAIWVSVIVNGFFKDGSKSRVLCDFHKEAYIKECRIKDIRAIIRYYSL